MNRYLIVRYFDGQKGYTYETSDESINVEDFVIVPMGKYNEHVVAKVIGEVTSKPHFECKKIIKKIDLYESNSIESLKIGDAIFNLESQEVVEISSEDILEEASKLSSGSYVKMHRNSNGELEFDSKDLWKLGE